MKYCESTEFPQCRQRNECKECRWSVGSVDGVYGV